jgi:UDP-N-acetylglucosamine--N-acetylmuramyl-(pentapeptide) pyrophosphoryl-undecaprenol N-acetylglucosamine transferase
MNDTIAWSPLFLLSGGGTGGHVYPSLAVAAALKQTLPESRLAYVGSPDGMEGDMVRREGHLPFHAVDTAAIKGRGPLALLRNVVRLVRGVSQAVRLIRQTRPAAIFGTGGYVCVPVFVAAWLCRIPSAIYLPDVVPGLAVRAIARIATLTVTSIADAAPFLHKQAVEPAQWQDSTQVAVTGYPVRTQIDPAQRAEIRARLRIESHVPVLLVYGGSRGARSINTAIAEHLAELLTLMQVIHVCGREGDESWLRTAVDALPEALRARYRLYPYLAADSEVTMSDVLVAADLTVCRSGASVLGELPAAELPAVLVPLSFVHQDENADYLVRHGAAIKLVNETLAHELMPVIRQLLADATTLPAMRIAMRQCARPTAASEMANLLMRIGRR